MIWWKPIADFAINDIAIERRNATYRTVMIEILSHVFTDKWIRD